MNLAPCVGHHRVAERPTNSGPRLSVPEVRGEAAAAMLDRERSQQAGKPMPDSEMLDLLVDEFKRNYTRKKT